MEFRCDICGGLLAMDTSGEFAVCEYCGMRYPKERLQAKIQEIKGTVKVEGPVSVQGVETKAELFANAETYIKLGDYKRADETYMKAVKQYPDDSRSWWGVFKSGMEGCDYKNPNWGKLIECDEYAVKAMKLDDYSGKYDEMWERLYNKYGTVIHIRKNADSLYEEIEESDINLLALENEKLIGHIKLQELKSKILSSYIDAMSKGMCSLFRFDNIFSNESEDMKKIMEIGKNNARLINNDEMEFCNLNFLKDRILYMDRMIHVNYERDWPSLSKYTKKDNMLETLNKAERFHYFMWKELHHVYFWIGSTIIVQSVGHDEGNPVREKVLLFLKEPIELEELQNMTRMKKIFDSDQEVYENNSIVGERMAQNCAMIVRNGLGACHYCGGAMKKGLFGVKCSLCGKKQ